MGFWLQPILSNYYICLTIAAMAVAPSFSAFKLALLPSKGYKMHVLGGLIIKHSSISTNKPPPPKIISLYIIRANHYPFKKRRKMLTCVIFICHSISICYYNTRALSAKPVETCISTSAPMNMTCSHFLLSRQERNRD